MGQRRNSKLKTSYENYLEQGSMTALRESLLHLIFGFQNTNGPLAMKGPSSFVSLAFPRGQWSAHLQGVWLTPIMVALGLCFEEA